MGKEARRPETPGHTGSSLDSVLPGNLLYKGVRPRQFWWLAYSFLRADVPRPAFSLTCFHKGAKNSPFKSPALSPTERTKHG